VEHFFTIMLVWKLKQFYIDIITKNYSNTLQFYGENAKEDAYEDKLSKHVCDKNKNKNKNNKGIGNEYARCTTH
jgi:hypothetical protein